MIEKNILNELIREGQALLVLQKPRIVMRPQNNAVKMKKHFLRNNGFLEVSFCNGFFDGTKQGRAPVFNAVY